MVASSLRTDTSAGRHQGASSASSAGGALDAKLRMKPQQDADDNDGDGGDADGGDPLNDGSNTIGDADFADRQVNRVT